MIRALVFDFDGLILETEVPVLTSWQETYREHGFELPLKTWNETIGTADHPFDAMAHLEDLLGRELDRESVTQRRKLRRDAILHAQDVLPGVRDYIRDARALGLQLGLASSSSRKWVLGHLARLDLDNVWDSIVCADDVERTKPDPALFLAVAAKLGVEPAESLALEDSPNGITSAKAAGMPCVAVPSSLTREMDLTAADLRVESLAEIPLAELLARLT